MPAGQANPDTSPPRAAYEYGDAWLDGLMRYLDGNRKHLTALVKQELPQAVLTPMDA